MRYIIVMSLAGSILFLAFLFVEMLGDRYFCMRDRTVFLRLIVAFFLIPSVPIAVFYRYIWSFLKEQIDLMALLDEESAYRLDYIVYHAGKQMDLSNSLNVLLFGGVVWILGGCIAFALDKTGAILQLRRIRVCSQLSHRKELLALLDKLRSEYGIRRGISLYEYPVPISSFTVGTIHPKIFIYPGDSDETLELILRHEMIHIRRFDVLLKQLTAIATYLHWFNPLVYFLKYKVSLITELTCDECLTQRAVDHTRRQYANLLVETAKLETTVCFSNHFSEQRSLKKRIEYIMKDHSCNSWKRYVVGSIMALLVLGTSFVSLANPSISQVEFCENVLCEVDMLADGDAMFLANGFAADWTSDAEPQEILAAEQFVAEDGTIYVIDPMASSSYFSCTHSFVSGVYQSHVKNADRSCVVRSFRAERCSKCGLVRVYEQISKVTYEPCPH